jgi:hypothetical protein
MARRALTVAFAVLALSACRPPDASAGEPTAGGPPGFDGPAAAVHDAVADVYLVSNVRGVPLAKDNNGYISRVSPKDRSMQRYWIEGGKNGVTLHAPKGMAITGDVLWVADIDTLRAFDRTSGAPVRSIAVPGATSLQDVAAGADGMLFVSDAGLDANGKPTGTDAIWRLTYWPKTEASGTCCGAAWIPQPLVRGTELGQPHGLVAHKNNVYFVSWRDGTFWLVDPRGVLTQLAKAATAQLDGLVRVEAKDGADAPAWFASSWAGKCLHRFDVCGSCTTLPQQLEQAGDCGFDAGRRLLLVPLFGRNRLEFVSL